ncbi:MAG: hypothetical protein KF774_09995 [Planctomyces sp.]|nr:hypothetical protein [Planctomyces sp.]
MEFRWVTDLVTGITQRSFSLANHRFFSVAESFQVSDSSWTNQPQPLQNAQAAIMHALDGGTRRTIRLRQKFPQFVLPNPLQPRPAANLEGRDARGHLREEELVAGAFNGVAGILGLLRAGPGRQLAQRGSLENSPCPQKTWRMHRPREPVLLESIFPELFLSLPDDPLPGRVPDVRGAAGDR